MFTSSNAAQFFWGPMLTLFLLMLPVVFVCNHFANKISKRFGLTPIADFVLYYVMVWVPALIIMSVVL